MNRETDSPQACLTWRGGAHLLLGEMYVIHSDSADRRPFRTLEHVVHVDYKDVG